MPPKRVSTTRVPHILGFPLTVAIALGTSAALYSVAAEFTGSELRGISKSLNEPWQITAFVGWRILELYTFWLSALDFHDVASLTLLTVIPYHSLLYFFYSISPTSVLISLAIDLVSSAAPFLLLRTRAEYNNPPKSAPTATQLSTSFVVRFFVSGFLTVTYAVTLFACLQSFLPTYIIRNFDIRTLEPVRAATLPVLVAACIPLGEAAKNFLYIPSTYLAKATPEAKAFNPSTATLGETLAYNLGLSGWGKREDVLVLRTLLLAATTVAASVAKIYGTVEGAELTGAAGWGIVWAATGVLAGAGLAYIGDV